MKNLLVLLRQILRLFFLPFYLINIFVPKYKNIWVFSAWAGKHYTGNSKALFEYVNKYYRDMQAIWLTKNKKVIEEINNKNLKAYSFYSIQGIYYSLVAKVSIVTLSWLDLPLTSLLFPLKTYYIQLWHGTPLKKLNLDAGTILIKILRFILISYLGRRYDLIISSTKLNKKIYKNIFNINKTSIKITGQPYNDLIFLSNRKIANKRNVKKILYAPTWRKYKFNFFDHGFNLDKINTILNTYNSILFIKFHLSEIKKHSQIINKIRSDRIIFFDKIDIYPFLKDFDILITDYSSIYFDFLLLNRPILFAPFDLKKYQASDGFYYNYGTVTPGPKSKNWNELLNNIELVLKGNHNDKYKSQREKINKIFNKFSDSQSSKRVYFEINKIL